MPERKDNAYESLVVINLVCLLLFLWKKQEGILWFDGALTISCVLIPFLRYWVHRGWTLFFQQLGRINAFLLLSMVFFLVLFPLALIRRLFIKKPDGQFSSRFVTRDHEFTANDFVKPG